MDLSKIDKQTKARLILAVKRKQIDAKVFADPAFTMMMTAKNESCVFIFFESHWNPDSVPTYTIDGMPYSKESFERLKAIGEILGRVLHVIAPPPRDGKTVPLSNNEEEALKRFEEEEARCFDDIPIPPTIEEQEKPDSFFDRYTFL